MQRLLRLRRGQLIALAAVVAVAIGAGTWLVLSGSGGTASASPTAVPSASPSPSPSPSPTPTPTPTPTPLTACPFTGLPVEDEALLELTALAVQVENNPAARPARNLSNADIVVEAPVEGDTTRFTAIFACQHTEGLTGPIRSARYYNIDLWQDLGALTVGFGASPGSLQRFSAAGMPYVNGITGGWPWFTRFGTHKAPHNLYGDLEALRSTLGNSGQARSAGGECRSHPAAAGLRSRRRAANRQGGRGIRDPDQHLLALRMDAGMRPRASGRARMPASRSPTRSPGKRSPSPTCWCNG